MNKKVPGKELKTTIAKAITFMNKDVKTILGIKPTISTTPKEKTSSQFQTPNNQKSGFFGGYNIFI